MLLPEERFWRLKAVRGLIGQVRPGNRHLLEEGTRLRVGYGQRHFQALGAVAIGQTLTQTPQRNPNAQHQKTFLCWVSDLFFGQCVKEFAAGSALI